MQHRDSLKTFEQQACFRGALAFPSLESTECILSDFPYKFLLACNPEDMRRANAINQMLDRRSNWQMDPTHSLLSIIMLNWDRVGPEAHQSTSLEYLAFWNSLS